MKLTRYTDYALRVLMYLGLHAERLCSIKEIADSFGASENHLMKVVQGLAGNGFVTSLRGRGGGLRLGRRPESIRIGDVVRLTEPDFDIADCATCILAPACGLTPVLTRATSAFLSVLDDHTLADLIRTPDAQRSLLKHGLDRRSGRKPTSSRGSTRARA